MGSWPSFEKASFIGIKLNKHRDMKPANVMRKNNNLKIGDFGFSKKT